MQAIVIGLYLGEFHLPFGCARMFGTVPLSCVPEKSAPLSLPLLPGLFLVSAHFLGYPRALYSRFRLS